MSNVIEKLEKVKEAYSKRLTVVVIYREEDKKYLSNLIKTLPNFAKTIILKTLNKGGNYEITSKIEQDGILWCEMATPEMPRFDHVRNRTNELVDTPYILQLDSDERLLTHQHKGIEEAMSEMDRRPGVGGAMIWIMSTYLHTNETPYSQQNKLLRLYRKGLNYICPVHEGVAIDLGLKSYEYIDTTLKIDHVGYQKPAEEMREKMLRNLELYLLEPELLMKIPKYFKIFLRDINNLIMWEKNHKENNNGS